MMIKGLKVLLPGIQIVVAIFLLVFGGRGPSLSNQDSPPYLAPATELCQGINAPVVIVSAGMVGLATKFNIYPGYWSLAASLCGIALLWFFVALEIESCAGVESNPRWLIFPEGTLLVIGFSLVPFGILEWRQGEAIMATGSEAWAVVLIAFCGIRLVRFVVASTSQ